MTSNANDRIQLYLGLALVTLAAWGLWQVLK